MSFTSINGRPRTTQMMAPSVCAYVDGESLFIRTEEAVKERLGKDVELEDLAPVGIIAKKQCHFFWNLSFVNINYLKRLVYFSSFTGQKEDAHNLCDFIRKQHFEPHLFQEDKDLFKRRKNKLEDAKVIEKPKGADISLTVRVIEDASNNVFDCCHLFTSDADYLPLIEAVRRMGKIVHVFGYADNLGDRRLKYVPDEFHDIGGFVKNYKLKESLPA